MRARPGGVSAAIHGHASTLRRELCRPPEEAVPRSVEARSNVCSFIASRAAVPDPHLLKVFLTVRTGGSHSAAEQNDILCAEEERPKMDQNRSRPEAQSPSKEPKPASVSESLKRLARRAAATDF
jgi:hypothetical protein